jgi:hypothetical protein
LSFIEPVPPQAAAFKALSNRLARRFPERTLASEVRSHRNMTGRRQIPSKIQASALFYHTKSSVSLVALHPIAPMLELDSRSATC